MDPSVMTMWKREPSELDQRETTEGHDGQEESDLDPPKTRGQKHALQARAHDEERKPAQAWEVVRRHHVDRDEIEPSHQQDHRLHSLQPRDETSGMRGVLSRHLAPADGLERAHGSLCSSAAERPLP